MVLSLFHYLIQIPNRRVKCEKTQRKIAIPILLGLRICSIVPTVFKKLNDALFIVTIVLQNIFWCSFKVQCTLI